LPIDVSLRRAEPLRPPLSRLVPWPDRPAPVGAPPGPHVIAVRHRSGEGLCAPRRGRKEVSD